jgi:tetratricopeptide (TPR) repeat protein
LKGLLQLGDIYLDPFPVGDAESVRSALELGLPVVAMSGTPARTRATAGLLVSLGLDENVAADREGYFARATELARDAALRADLRSRTTQALAASPIAADALALGDALGAVLLQACEELSAHGAAAFRRAATPISTAGNDIAGILAAGESLLAAGLADDAWTQACAALAAQPSSLPARHLMGRVLDQRGQRHRARDYLLAAIEGGCAPAAVWRDLAGLLDRLGQGPDAISAIDTALRLAPEDVESWFVLGELAQRRGHAEILRDVAGFVQRHAPDDPRAQQLLAACS